MGSKMLRRLFTPPDEGSYFLFGPRGTGKTTWLKQHYPEAYWVNLIEPETFTKNGIFSAIPWMNIFCKSAPILLCPRDIPPSID
jgi:hypothetical protein